MAHDFSKSYGGLLAQGLDRATDLATLGVYLQKFSADDMLAALLPRLSAGEIDALFAAMAGPLRRHLTEAEYHRLFLGDA